MKALISLEEQIRAILTSSNLESIRLDDVKIKNDKITLKLSYKIDSNVGVNDCDFTRSQKISLKCNNDKAILIDKLKKKFKNLSEITSTIEEINLLRAEYNMFISEHNTDIIQFIETQINNNKLQMCKYINSYIFHNTKGFLFMIHPKDTAPADGEYFILSIDGKIEIHDWYGVKNKKDFSNLFRNIKYSHDAIIGLTERIEDLEKFNYFIENFQTNEIINKMLSFHEKGHNLYLKLKELL